MIISLENLTDGMWWWNELKSAWGSDLGNSEYDDIYACRAGGLTFAWWEHTVERLSRWKATRAPGGLNSREKIRVAGLELLPQLAACYARLLPPGAPELALESLRWQDIEPLYQAAFRLKWPHRRNASPMFASKLCHFIFPCVFPIVDNEATGFFDYEFYWRGMQDEWQRFSEKEQAIAVLKQRIGPTIHPQYPLECRVIELSHIGYAHADEITRLRATTYSPAVV